MTNSTQDQKAYNVITSGFGYLNRVRRIKPSKGNHYYAINVVLLEGVVNNEDYSNLTRTSYDARVVGPAVDAIEKHFAFSEGSSANFDAADLPESTIVTASVKLAGCDPQPYNYTKDGEQRTGISIRTRLLNITWLKIGDDVIQIESQAAEASQEPQPKQPEMDAQIVGKEAEQSDSEMSSEGWPKEISLDQTDPSFATKLEAIKKSGIYRYDSDKKAWLRSVNAIGASVAIDVFLLALAA